MLFYINKRVACCLSLIMLLSCSQSNFYEEYQVDDLWRLPLIKPYELKNVAGAKPEHFSNDNWHISFYTIKDNFKDSFDGLNVTNINCTGSIIYGYGSKFPCYPFIINLRANTEKIYLNKQKWENTLDSLGANSKKLYDVFDVFEDFKNRNILPWH